MNIKQLPNLLTLARIVAIPAVVALLLVPGDGALWGALGVFAAASVTDFLDGWVARRYRAFSRFGTMLDPIADKLLVAAVLLMLAARGTVSGVHVIAIVAILGREIAISGLREFLAADRIALPVTTLAKWKTAAQMIALCLLLLPIAASGAVQSLALGALWLAAALSLWTGYVYAAGTYSHWRFGSDAQS